MTGWSEESEGFLPGNRRAVGGSGPFTFTPGSTQYLDYAIIFARDSHQPGTDVLETLRAYADEIVGMECGQLPQIVTGTRTSKEPIKQVRVYPNPASHQIHVDAPEKASTYIIYDLSGRIVQNGMVEGAYGRIDILLLSPGLYTLVLINGEGSPLGRARFVKAF